MQQVAQGTSASLYTPSAALLCLSGCVSHPGKVMKAIKNLMTTAYCLSPERGLGLCICYLKFKNPVQDACRKAASNSFLQSLESSPCSQHARGGMSGQHRAVCREPLPPSKEREVFPQHLSKGSFPLQGGGGSQSGCLMEGHCHLSPVISSGISSTAATAPPFHSLPVKGRLMETWVTCFQRPIISTTRALSVSDI